MEMNPQSFPFGQKGIIVSGELLGWRVEIVDDTAGKQADTSFVFKILTQSQKTSWEGLIGGLNTPYTWAENSAYWSV
jgi:hypothetical protein